MGSLFPLILLTIIILSFVYKHEISVDLDELKKKQQEDYNYLLTKVQQLEGEVYIDRDVKKE